MNTTGSLLICGVTPRENNANATPYPSHDAAFMAVAPQRAPADSCLVTIGTPRLAANHPSTEGNTSGNASTPARNTTVAINAPFRKPGYTVSSPSAPAMTATPNPAPMFNSVPSTAAPAAAAPDTPSRAASTLKAPTDQTLPGIHRPRLAIVQMRTAGR